MAHLGIQLRKALVFIHRWMGVAFCSLFFLWFTSGIVMMYCDFPSVSEADRLNHAPPLQVSEVRLSPLQALASLRTAEPPDSLRLLTFDDRPAYRFGFEDSEVMVFADNGQPQTQFPPDTTLSVASQWAAETPAAAQMEELTSADQWTVSDEFTNLRPLRKYSWPDGKQVYVSAITGSVVQYTTRASRIGAYLGPIPHWLYFTPLRKHGEQWSQLVIWASGLATIAAILGITIGVWTLSPSKTFRVAGKPSSLPYTGAKRWHAVLGLIFGVLACTWAFSGMLSMDPFPKWQGEEEVGEDAAISGVLRGELPSLIAFLTEPPQEVLAESGAAFPVKELEFTSFAGDPAYLASAGPHQTRIVPVRGNPIEALDMSTIVGRIRKVIQPYAITQVRQITKYEAYYVDRHARLPLPVLFVQLSDPDQSEYYIDPKTAEIVQSNNSLSRRNRWLYHGFHSIDLPWLYAHRPAWDVLVLTLLLAGVALSVTSLILAWRVLGRTLRAATTVSGNSDGDANRVETPASNG